MLLEAGADVNKADTSDGRCPLHIAAHKGHVEVSRALMVAAGVDVHLADSDGFSALHHASYHGHVPIVKALLDGGARADQAGGSEDHRTPILLAFDNGHAQVVDVILCCLWSRWDGTFV